MEEGRNDLKRTGEKLHNEELQNLYSSPSIIRMITSRRTTYQIASMEANTGF
jgi:hypothetical protein